MKWTLLLGWLFFATVAAGAARADDSADALAQGILQKAKIHVGVCEMPRVGDGTLAVALARQNVMEIQALAPDFAAADAARKPADAAHVLGSQVVVETGSPSAIPLQDWTADLVVVADATDANLAQIPPAEVKRVLSPYRGVAIVGQPANGKGALTVSGLTAWANQLGGAADVKQDDTGLWAVVKMPPLAGGDDWSHYYHGPDGNPVSNDTVLKGPDFGLQWMGGPYWAGKFDVHVAAGGREFHAQSTIYWRLASDLQFIVRARSLYNGQVLWEHPIAKDFGDIGSLMIATPDRLYIKDGGSAEALDAETGDELLRYGDKDKDDCKWLMLSDGVLVTMNGPKRKIEWGPGSNSPTGKTHEEQQDYENDTFYASEMDAWDAATGKNLWQFTDKRIDPAKTVVRDGHVYFYADYAYAACLDLKTGKQLWKTPAPIEDPDNPGMGLGWALNAIMTPRQSAIATDQVYLINSHAHMQSVAFAVADGKMLWEKMKGKLGDDSKKTMQAADEDLMTYPIFLDGKFREKWKMSWDPLTGKPIPGPATFDYSGCGHFTATESGLLFGQCGGVFDQGDHRWDVTDNFSKAACGVSQFAADGTLVKAPSDCPACTEWRGFIVSRSGTDDSAQGVRLEKGPAFDATPAIAACDGLDWPTYRSTGQRCASSAAALPAGDATIRWTYAPTPSLKPIDTNGGNYTDLPRANPSPPISVGDRIYFGTADGAEVCLDRATGQEQWRYWTGGQIMSAPTWAAGRLYVGSNDGWVYCLTADTGQLVWRYRVAPVDRQVMVFGRLSSQWPVMANVLVQDGTAYAAGGFVGPLGGSVMCALDARTGQVKWEKDMLKTDGTGSAPASAAGQLAYYHGQIFWHVANGGVRAVDASTGKITLAPDLTGTGTAPDAASNDLYRAFYLSHGEDIGVMPGGWIAAGGLEFLLPPAMDEEPRNRTLFVQTDANGLAKPNVFALTRAQAQPFLPAWDDKDVLITGGTWASGGKTEFLPPTLWQGFDADLSAFAAAHPLTLPTNPLAVINLEKDSVLLPADTDSKPAIPTKIAQVRGAGWHDPVLASNASVFLGNNWGHWGVYMFDRTTGTELNQIPLKGRPVMNGLALTRTGDVLVPMIDGQLCCIGPAPVAPGK